MHVGGGLVGKRKKKSKLHETEVKAKLPAVCLHLCGQFAELQCTTHTHIHTH